MEAAPSPAAPSVSESVARKKGRYRGLFFFLAGVVVTILVNQGIGVLQGLGHFYAYEHRLESLEEMQRYFQKAHDTEPTLEPLVLHPVNSIVDGEDYLTGLSRDWSREDAWLAVIDGEVVIVTRVARGTDYLPEGALVMTSKHRIPAE